MTETREINGKTYNVASDGSLYLRPIARQQGQRTRETVKDMLARVRAKIAEQKR